MKIYIERRNKILRKLKDDGIIIIFGNRDKYKNNDVKYRFRQNSDFLYLAGLNEPNSIMVIKKLDVNSFETILFRKKKSYTEKIWENNHGSDKEIINTYEIDYTYDIKNFERYIAKYLIGKNTVYYISENKTYYKNYIKNILNKFDIKKKHIKNINHFVHGIRIIKDSFELDNIRKSSYISSESHLKVLSNIKPNIMEYQIESIFLKNCMDLGASEQAYNAIVAAGKNACTLHYSENNDIVKDNDLILIDAGCEYNGYASDITRTYPVNGRFNSEQKVIYEIVLHAQKEAIKYCQIGNSWKIVNEIIVNILSEGLQYFKIIKNNLSEIIEKQLYKTFYMHSPGHWLGLDVHDVGNYKKNREWCVFRENMYLTIEPGIYIREDNKTVEEKWKGIGIRIEDDILIKKTKNEILSELVPKDIKEIEYAIKQRF